MRVVIAGGGTGGHLYPGLAVAEALRHLAPRTEVLFVGGDRLEAQVVPREGWPFTVIAGRALPRRLSWRAAAALAATAWGTGQALALLARWRPAVVLATGGYVCAPVGAATAVLGIPLVLQEQNVSPGLTTRMLARWARRISVPHPAAARAFAPRRVEVTGVPVRRAALEGDRARGLARWGLADGRLTLLVLGGSQGAHSLNRAVCRLGDLLMYDARLQILHQTGAADLAWVREAIGRREHIGPPALAHVPVAFLEQIGDAYACADLVVCRAGASTLAEVAAWGRPAVLVPYPHAAAGHQEANTEVPVAAGAAVRVRDADLDGVALVDAVRGLIDDAPRRAAMAAASRALGRPDAAARVAALVLATGGAPVPQEAGA